MKNIRFDENLMFEIDDGFEFIENINEDGIRNFSLGRDKKTNEKGETYLEYHISVKKCDLEDSVFNPNNDSSESFKLNGDVDNYVTTVSNEMQILSFITVINNLDFQINHNGNVYSLFSTRVFSEKNKEEETKKWLSFVNSVIGSIVIDGVKGNFEELTYEMLKKATEKNYDMPYAEPSDGQHSQLDFINRSKGALAFLGGIASVNQTGTEYAFMPLMDFYDEYEESSKVYKKAFESDGGSYNLSKTAKKMAELFRVDAEFFDEEHDREQEILAGLIQRISFYSAFRSFAWTFAAYCDKENVKPEDVSIETIEEIVAFVESRHYVNYKGDSFLPAICSGDDIHNYYISDSVSNADRKAILSMEDDSEEFKSSFVSLEELRKELEILYPAMRKIHDSLEESRDRSEPLEGGSADILYVWCSFTYAARYPVYSEDGPMTCEWEHPGNIPADPNASKAKSDDIAEKVKNIISYNQKLSVSGDGYRMDIPDGFVIKKNVENRDFVAYLPDESDPDDYMSSPFVIYAGQKQENEIFKSFRIPLEFSAMVTGMSAASAASGIVNTKKENLMRADLPGAIVFGFEGNALHANAFLGMDDHIRMMRVMILEVANKDKAMYEAVVRQMFNGIYADKPVPTLEDPCEKKYLSMETSGKTCDEWINLVNQYATHIAISRALGQNGLVQGFQMGQKMGKSDPAALKRDLKSLLNEISKYTDSVLRKAEFVYVFKRVQYPDSPNLKKMKEQISELIKNADQSVELDGKTISVNSEFAAAAGKRMKMDASKAANALMEDLSDDEKKLLRSALDEYDEKLKAVKEEKERIAAEKAKLLKEKEQKEAEARKRAIEKAKAAEEKRRAEEKKRAEEKAEANRIAAEKAEAEAKKRAEEKAKEEEARRNAIQDAKNKAKKKLLSFFAIVLCIPMILSVTALASYSVVAHITKDYVAENIKPVVNEMYEIPGVKNVDVRICVDPDSYDPIWYLNYHTFLTVEFASLAHMDDDEMLGILNSGEEPDYAYGYNAGTDYAVYTYSIRDTIFENKHPIFITLSDGSKSFTLEKGRYGDAVKLSTGNSYEILKPVSSHAIISVLWMITILFFALFALVFYKRNEETFGRLVRNKKFLVILAVVVGIVVISIVGLQIYKKVVIPTKQYEQAMELKTAGEDEKAYAVFKSLGNFKDAEEICNAYDYEAALSLVDTVTPEEAYRLLKKMSDYKPAEEKIAELLKANPYLSILESKSGDEIVFGKYEQDNNLSNGAENIEWIVLKNENSVLFAVSKYILDSQVYNTLNGEGSTLKVWLKDDFNKSAFNGISDGFVDKVGLLTREDVETYESIVLTQPEWTKYAMAQGPEKHYYSGYSWWLDGKYFRSDGVHMSVVIESGDYSAQVSDITDVNGVRPAIVIDYSTANVDYYASDYEDMEKAGT